jgi:hypothetical protein
MHKFNRTIFARTFPRLLAPLVAAVCLSTLASMATSAHASSRRYQSSYVGVRPAAMGNAFTAVADDANALYYNPAGLARLETWNLDILSIILGLNQASYQNAKDVTELFNSGQGSSKSDDPAAVVEKLRPVLGNISGENHYARFGINPSFVMQNFGLGLYSGVEAELVPHINGLPKVLDVAFLIDNQFRVGGAYQFFGKKLAVGATVNFLARATATLEDFGVFEVVDASQDKNALKSKIEQSFASGYGVGMDTGLLFTPVELWKPTIGIAVKNIGDTGFYFRKLVQSSELENTPPPLRQSVNAGFSITPQWGRTYLRSSVDFRDLNVPIPASKKLGYGVEAGIKGNFLKGSLLGGMSEGYLTGGFEVDLFLFALRYATYVTDLGTFPTEKPERRHVIQMKVLM